MMRKTVIMSCLAFTLLYGNAQDNGGAFPSWWNEIAKESPDSSENADTVAVAVGNLTPIKSVYQSDSYLLDCIRPAFRIIKQQYQIKDVKQDTYHGKNSMDYFGESYSIAIQINKGFILTQLAMAPWEYDEDFAAVNNRGKTPQYEGVLYDVFMRNPDESTFVKYNFEPKYFDTIVNDKLYDYDTGSRDFGMTIDKTDGLRSGVLVVCSTMEPLDQNPGSELILTARPLSMDVVRGENKALAITNLSDPNVIGGVFVTPFIPQAGTVVYSISGVLVKQIDGSWAVVPTCE